MAKKQEGVWIIVILVVVGILLGAKFGLFDFIIIGSETISRSFPSEVTAGSSVTITYSVSGASGKWAASVIDLLMSCKDKDGNLIPIDLTDPTGWKGDVTRKFVMVSTEGTTTTQIFPMPNVEGVTCNLQGNYKFGDKAIKNFPTQIIKTKIICLGEADTNCDGIVDRTELGVYINKWIAGTATRSKLGQVIMDWVSS